MTHPLSPDLHRTLLKNLRSLLQTQAAERTHLETEWKATQSSLKRRFDDSGSKRQQAHDAAQQAARTAYDEQRATMVRTYDDTFGKAKQKYDAERFRINERADNDERVIRKSYKEAIWSTDTVYETKQHQPEERFEKYERSVRSRRQSMRGIESQAKAHLARCRMASVAPPPVEIDRSDPTEPGDETHFDDLKLRSQVAGEEAQAALTSLKQRRLPRLFVGIKPIILLLLGAGVGGAYRAWEFEWQLDEPVWIAAGIGAGVVTVLLFTFYLLARRQAAADFARMQQSILDGLEADQDSIACALTQRYREEQELREARNAERERAKSVHEPKLKKIRAIRKRLLHALDAEASEKLGEMTQRHEAEIEELDSSFHTTFEAQQAEHDVVMERESKDFDKAMAEATEAYDTKRRELDETWQRETSRINLTLRDIQAADSRAFLPWNHAGWNSWEPPFAFTPALRFGSIHIDPAAFLAGDDQPAAEVLPLDEIPPFDLPAVVNFPAAASILIETDDAGRESAVATLQTIMLRALTTIPPGKLRFTIVDPVGLGQNFAGFMHLADYDEASVSSRIWTDQRHIEQRLTDLTEHMENVIQKYLRNEYETIAEYNEKAGEIAEPFRFLVIADFPVNFTDASARRLLSILESGPRCGVFTFLMFDQRQKLPQGIRPSDLRSHAVTIQTHQDGGTLDDEDWRDLPLTLDPPPDSDFLNRMLHTIGQAASEASRVELPFTAIAPPPETMWTLSSAREMRVPLGQSGATKIQHLALGRGTAQHVLIAGKTGSGKSTLLHVLITSAALFYSPDEVELYLIDFKKGVEFKTYATHRLPHARAVAIESDREFGLSVLQRLDAELKTRGDLYRDLGVQDLAAFREARPDQPMPRIMLVIDEFQEFFTEDDRIAQEASLLLDRLVRQGRAFGVHVLLGSQTLSGAYSLARSTITQMAVRIALQCSEADAHLIMSDDNAAARLLSRPGEAIYNDQAGRLEGNSPFQIVWLPDETRETYLTRVQKRSQDRKINDQSPMIVFEGNVPANMAENALLKTAIHQPYWPSRPIPVHGWLGEAIAIKDPTAAVFRRQSGGNLLIVGQRDESVMAMITSLGLSIAAQVEPTATLRLLDGTPADSPLAGHLARLAAIIPHDASTVGIRDAEAVMASIHDSLEQRQEENLTDAPTIFLIIHGLQRFRSLRKGESDFGFSVDESASGKPDRQLANILREGPAYGIHTIIWCDTGTNFSRAIDRALLREFDMRVLFQMNASDSSNLIDSAVAEKLGQQRALYYNEESGTLEKFRPYALPDEAWLLSVEAELADRAESRGMHTDAPQG